MFHDQTDTNGQGTIKGENNYHNCIKFSHGGGGDTNGYG